MLFLLAILALPVVTSLILSVLDMRDRIAFHYEQEARMQAEIDRLKAELWLMKLAVHYDLETSEVVKARMKALEEL